MNFRRTNRLIDFRMPPSVDEWLPLRHLARFVAEDLELSAMSKGYRGFGFRQPGGSAAEPPGVRARHGRFPARQGRLRSQVITSLRQPAAGQLEGRVAAQVIQVVSIREATGDRGYAGLQDPTSCG
jgi:hypothetical protein